jgi:hypothetical protein
MEPDYTTQDRLKITAGAITALIIVGWIMYLALAVLSVP